MLPRKAVLPKGDSMTFVVHSQKDADYWKTRLHDDDEIRVNPACPPDYIYGVPEGSNMWVVPEDLLGREGKYSDANDSAD